MFHLMAKLTFHSTYQIVLPPWVKPFNTSQQVSNKAQAPLDGIQGSLWSGPSLFPHPTPCPPSPSWAVGTRVTVQCLRVSFWALSHLRTSSSVCTTFSLGISTSAFRSFSSLHLFILHYTGIILFLCLFSYFLSAFALWYVMTMNREHLCGPSLSASLRGHPVNVHWMKNEECAVDKTVA